MRSLPAALGLSLLVAGCGDDRAKAEDAVAAAVAAATPIPLDRFCTDYLEALCGRIRTCELYGDAGALTPYEDCGAWVTDAVAGCEGDWVSLVEGGAATYDPAEGGKAVAWAEVAGCASVFATERLGDPVDLVKPRIRKAFVGASAEGGPCHDDLACQDPLTCTFDGACPGACAPPPEPMPRVAEGRPCGDDAGIRCGRDHHCAPDDRCRRWARTGDPCGADLPRCDPYRSWCDPEAEACAALPGPGEDCGLGAASYCASATCDPDIGACVRPLRDAGAHCDPRQPRVCASWHCSEVGVCEPTGWPPDPCPTPAPTPDAP